ncbi:MAG: hypothetical protein F6K41_20395 [Symploca sp. SIO3E6]|nr:hypothetical protein [Caldora sp. SIO3E6]
MSNYYLKVSGSTNVLEASTSGFTQENQSNSPSQKFSIDPNSSFKTVKCLNNYYWKYTTELTLEMMPSGDDNMKFKVTLNPTSNDYEIFCKAVNNGNTRLTVAGAYEFDLQNV